MSNEPNGRPDASKEEEINPSIFAGIPKEMIRVRIKDAKPLGVDNPLKLRKTKEDV